LLLEEKFESPLQSCVTPPSCSGYFSISIRWASMKDWPKR